MRKVLGSVAVVLALMVACSSAAPDPASKTTVVEAPKKPAWARSYRFTDTTSGAVASSTRTWGSTWADFDSDGDPDPLVNRHWGTPQFLVNRNDEFHHYAGRIDWHPGPKKTDRHACAWGEANRDGRPDLYCTQGADMGTGSGPNRLYVQARDGFDERARQYDVTNPKGRGRTVNWLDYDSDGDLDLFVGNAERSITTNLMFRHTRTKYVRARVGLDQDLSTAGSSWADWDRDGDPDLTIQQHDPYPTLAYENVKKRFKPVRLAGITGKTWLAATWGDFNGDGWPDVAMVGNNSAAIFRNNRGRFRRVRRVKVAEGRMGVWLDVENDGDLDLFVVQGAIGQRPQPDSKNYGDLLFVRRKGKFVKIVANGASSEGSGDAVSASDYDRDGRVDVLVTNGYFYYEGPNELLRNTSSARNWAGLQLRGPRANPLGFGATVRVETNGRTYHRQITDNFSFRAQSEVGYVHLGLGRARTARVRVDWPGRDTDCLSVTEGSVTQVRHGTNRCR